MGFLSGFGRMIVGKPIFENQSSNTENVQQPTSGATPDPTNGGLRDASGHKVLPQIDVAHIKSSRNGNNMTVEAWVTNHSELAIRLDDCYILHQRTQVHYALTPHQNHQVILYRGPIAANEHDAKAKLTFRILANTDEFEMDYRTEFYRNSDGTFMVEELHRLGNVRDI